jgi:hypothetical protein
MSLMQTGNIGRETGQDQDRQRRGEFSFGSTKIELLAKCRDAEKSLKLCSRQKELQ